MTHTQTQGADGADDAGTEWFWRIVDANGLGNVPSDEGEALRLLCLKASRYDEGQSASSVPPGVRSLLHTARSGLATYGAGAFEGTIAQIDAILAFDPIFSAPAATPGVPDSVRALALKLDAARNGAEWKEAENEAFGAFMSWLGTIAAHPAGQAGDAGAVPAQQRVERPFAFCCNMDPATCDCANPNHGTALFEVKRTAPNSTRTGAAETAGEIAHAGYYGAPVQSLRDGWTALPQTVRDNWERAATALAASPEAPSDAGWSFDMEAAPKDGTPLLCVEYDEPQKVVDLHWFRDGGTASSWRGSFGQIRRPIAWRPLPTPPSDPAPSGQAEG